MPRTRFAPSPTGPLHLGHVYAALFAHQAARRAGSAFLVRLEDLDQARVREAYAAEQLSDLTWLGLTPDAPVIRQSDRLAAYQQALETLKEAGLIYPCFCTRREILREIEASNAAPHLAGGVDGPIYPGTCRELPAAACQQRLDAGLLPAWRLDAAKASARAGELAWHECGAGAQAVEVHAFGDVVLARKDGAPAYHLAVTVDDAVSEIELVTRGHDLKPVSAIHRLLQALLGLPVPEWQHHALVVDGEGKRLAKRGGAAGLKSLREAGYSPSEVFALAERQLDSPIKLV